MSALYYVLGAVQLVVMVVYAWQFQTRSDLKPHPIEVLSTQAALAACLFALAMS